MKKFAGDIICVPKITIIWCTLPLIWSETGKKFCHFAPFFAILPIPLMIPKIKILKEKKKNEKNASRYKSFYTNMCIINEDHMIYGSWNIRCDRHFCHFGPFLALTIWKIKLLKKWKKPLEILSFYTCVSQMTIMWCMVLEIWRLKDRICCHFGPFFALLPP